MGRERQRSAKISDMGAETPEEKFNRLRDQIQRLVLKSQLAVALFPQSPADPLINGCLAFGLESDFLAPLQKCLHLPQA